MREGPSIPGAGTWRLGTWGLGTWGLGSGVWGLGVWGLGVWGLGVERWIRRPAVRRPGAWRQHGRMGWGASGRSLRQTCGGAPRRTRCQADSCRFVALFDCKFATLNQLFGGVAGTEPNWSGVRLSFRAKVASIASAESRRAVAGGRFGTVSCVEIGTMIDVGMQVQRRQGTAGVGDVLNEARARW
jgi:hypothetical protein